MLKLFLSFELTKKIKYFQSKTLPKLITTLLFLCVFIFIGMGIYFFFLSGFRFINMEATEDIRSALTLFIYEVSLLVLSGVIIFSSMVTGVFNLFRSDSNRWLISSPSYTSFPKLVLIRSLSSTLLLTVVMFLPAVAALNKVYDLPFISIFFTLLSVVALLIFLNALTLLGIVLVAHIYRLVSGKVKTIYFNFKGLIILLLSISALIVLGVVNTIRQVDLVKLFKADDDSLILSVQNISSHFTYLPTHPLALQILHWQTGQHKEALINFSIVVFLMGIATLAWWKLSYLFYPSWLAFQEGRFSSGHTISATSTTKPFLFKGSRLTALFKKEALVSIRNYKGLMWFVFLFIIWLLQVGTNVALHSNIVRYETDITEKAAILQSLQFIIALFFIAAFSLRFVFPSFSVEKKTAWILESAPLTFKKIFLSKYLFYTATFLAIGLLMEYINILILKISFVHATYSMFLFISSIVFIITLALLLGAFFPSQDTDDPEAISTSMPGLIFTALSLLYGAFNAYILYSTLLNENTNLLIIIITITCGLTALMLATGLLYPKKNIYTA